MRLVFFYLGISFSLFAKPLELEVEARSAILMNAETEAILYEKHPHVPHFPASTTKIATTLYVLDQGIHLDQQMTVSAECLHGRPLKDRDHPYWLDSDGTMAGLRRGEVLSLDALLHGMMLVSGNDAANTVAEAIGGTIPDFVHRLNEYLQSIGCKNTQFKNPHGLSHPDHYSTAYDMALIAKKALQLPKFRQIVSTLSYTKPKTNKQPPVEMKLTNPMMRPDSRHYYPKAIGIKTGYTAAAQYTLVAAAEQEGRTLIAVLLGCERSQRYETAKKLFETAFAEKKIKRRLMGVETIFVKGLTGSKKSIKACLDKELFIEFFPAEEPGCKAAIHWMDVHLPIRKGQKVGEIHILDEGSNRLLQKGDLLASEEVRGTFLFMVKQKMKSLLKSRGS